MAQVFGLPQLASLSDPSAAVDQSQLDRQMQLAKLLRAQSMQGLDPNRQIGGMGYTISPLEVAAKALQGYQATQLEGESDKQRQSLAEKQAKAYAAAIRGVFGDEATTAPVVPNGGRPEGVSADALAGGGFPQPAEQPQQPVDSGKAERRRAAMSAMLMGNNDLANKIIFSELEQTPEMKNLRGKGLDPKAVGQAEYGKLKKEGLLDVGAGNTIFDPATNKQVFTAPEKIPQGFTRDAKGGLQVDPNWLSAEMQLRNAGASRVQTNVNAFTPASETAQAEFMKGVRDRYDKLQSAPVLLANIERSKEIVGKANPFIGSLGDKKMAVAQFFNNNFGTNIAPEKIKDAGELGTRLFTQVMDNLKKMDAQPSTYQQKVMEDAFGKITTDPKALPAILDVFGEQTRQRVDIHNREVQGAAGRGVKFPYDPTINLPAVGGLPKPQAPKRRATDSQPTMQFDNQGNPL